MLWSFTRWSRVPEGDRIPSFESHREALKQEDGLPGVFCDCSDDYLWTDKPSRYVTSHPSQLSLAIPPWVVTVSTSERWGVNGHTARYTSPVSVVSQCKLASSCGLKKRRSSPPHGPCSSGRTLLTLRWKSKSTKMNFNRTSKDVKIREISESVKVWVVKVVEKMMQHNRRPTWLKFSRMTAMYMLMTTRNVMTRYVTR